MAEPTDRPDDGDRDDACGELQADPLIERCDAFGDQLGEPTQVERCPQPQQQWLFDGISDQVADAVTASRQQ